ncbi:AI-2E family transporter [Sulfurospirillum sp. 1612]|uniref:AI-2E family transporter n=1 Tax=Sulfurospirillum sp. 1612 TaxID=3094835 RepID=UPI002F954E31
MNLQRLFLIGIFLAVLYWILRLYQPFLVVITVASLLSIATYRINTYINKYVHHQVLSATISTIFLFLLFFAPIIYIITSAGEVINNFNPKIVDSTIAYIQNLHYTLPKSLMFLKTSIDEFINNIDLANITKNMISYLGLIGKNSANFLKDMLLILVFYFFVTLRSYELGNYFKTLLPMKEEEIDLVFGEVSNVMSVVFYSILATAIFEGILFAIIGVIFGYNGLLLGIFYGFASLIPIVGGALMWVPLSAYEFANGNYLAGFSIAIYSIIVISIVADTFIKPLIIKFINEKLSTVKANINELLVFFAILAGLTTFGFWGMILGPAITTLFISLMTMFKTIKEKGLDI